MIKMKCQCGEKEMTFKNLKESDLPEGWKCEKCPKGAKKEAPKAEAKKEEAPKEEKKEEEKPKFRKRRKSKKSE